MITVGSAEVYQRERVTERRPWTGSRRSGVDQKLAKVYLQFIVKVFLEKWEIKKILQDV